ncbi:zinc finger and SCAN domain-containing protein 2-like [Sabethes cyaneus]|uniref:zinc finger and SCAN domain-containing protein 2-like n=1 Tax=Sabethes cyaneus TaxID=53552 RepID=UPI00237D58BD|nr:zinc finger and SCAN domain-containing protein 2-like [Sabethes cyaneus]
MSVDSSCIIMPEYCRCCFVEDNDMIYVFDVLDEFDSKISNLINECGGIAITNDDTYSKNICGDCLNNLANAARFRHQCQRTQKMFRDAEHKTNMLLNTVQENPQTFAQVEQVVLQEIDEQNIENEAVIQYIIEETSNDTELQDFDYDNLISSQNSELEEVEIEQLFKESDGLTDFTSQPDSFETKPSVHADTMKLNFICPQCGAAFALQKNYVRHVTNHEKLICDVCLEVSEREEDHELHKLVHLPYKTAEMHSTGKLTGNNTEERGVFKGRHTCSYCQRSFASNSALTSHVRVHTQERPYPCSYCSKRFRTVGGHELHERRHRGIKPYCCDVCGRGFAESSNLKVHRRTHTKEKPHVCTICNRAFARVFLLQTHQRIHTEERPFSCPECGKSFRQQGDLSAHRRIHSGDRPFRCDICSKGFIKSSGYTQHMRKHSKQMHKFTSDTGWENVEDLIEYEYGIEVESGDRSNTEVVVDG